MLIPSQPKHLITVQATAEQSYANTRTISLSLSVPIFLPRPVIMQTLLSPAARSGFFPAARPQAVPARPSAYHLPLRSIPACHVPNITLSPSSSSSSAPLNHRGSRLSLASIVRASSTPISQNFTSPSDEAEKAKLLQVLSLFNFTPIRIVLIPRNVGKLKNIEF